MTGVRPKAAMAVLVAAVAVAAGYMLMELHPLGALGESNDSPSRSEIEILAGAPIPASASELQARVDLVITKRTLFLRFSADRAEVEAFLRGVGIELLSESGIPSFLLADGRPQWFRPESARQFRAGESPRKAVLVESPDEPRCTVYLRARS